MEEEAGEGGGTPEGGMPGCVDSRKWTLKPDWREKRREVASLEDIFPMDHDVAPEPASLVGWFGTAQLEDPNLASALQQVSVVDGKPVEG